MSERSVIAEQDIASSNVFGTRQFVTPVLILALGHMVSNLVRTLPAISADVMSHDLAVTPEGLASLTSAYHLSFATGQIPVGVALDRYGVKPVSLTLLAIVALGAAFAAMVQGPVGFLIAQLVLGLGCSGMLLCPMTFAARLLTPEKFGLWSGLTQGVGNCGMLLSASPMAWVVHHAGWRTGFWVAAVFGLLVLILVKLVVPLMRTQASKIPASIFEEAREVLRIGVSRRLRGVVILSFTSFAAAIAIRGLWGGPWLMDVKGMARIDAGNALIPFTLALIVGPVIYGLVDRRFGHRRLILGVGHLIAAGALLLLSAGGPGGWLSDALGIFTFPVTYDISLLLLFGTGIAVQPLLFAMGRAAVESENTGKALSAVNLFFFSGAAILQSATGSVSKLSGIPGVLIFLGMILLVSTIGFLVLTPKKKNL